MTTEIRTDLSFTKKKNIFCIEGSWENDHRSQLSVSKALEFLECVEQVNIILKQCYNEETLKQLIDDSMQKKYDKYSVLYFAFHGVDGEICVGKRNKTVSLDKIAEMIGDRANGKIIHFGCCNTLSIGKRAINKFLKSTNALAVSGYAKEIDFIRSTVYDLIYFQQCQEFKSIKSIQNKMKVYHNKLGNELGFIIHRRAKK